MRVSPFDGPGQFYKGNIHTHSSASDGDASPEEVCAAYRDRGYDFLAITEHWLPLRWFAGHRDEAGVRTVLDTTPYRTDDFTTILGAELHGPTMANGERWHVLALGLPIDFPAMDDEEREPAVDLVRRAREAGAWISFLHPHWNIAVWEDAVAMIDLCDAVEVYNHGAQVYLQRGWGTHFADQLWQAGYRTTLCMSDDAHFAGSSAPRYNDAFGAWMMVKAASLEPDALVRALKAGQFYSTQGPEFRDVRVDGGILQLETSPIAQVIVTGAKATFRVAFGDGMEATEIELPGAEKTPWFRVTIVDADGKVAMTNPVWYEDLP